MSVALHVETRAGKAPTLLLLHGMSVNAGVWEPLYAHLADWPGQILAPDLRGHGRSPWTRHYGYAHHAADVADLLERGARVHILGHSMGGAVGLTLANGSFGIDVAHVTAIGTKTDWKPGEREKMAGLAAAPTRWFETREKAQDRFLKVSGLLGLQEKVPAAVELGVVEENGRYRLAADIASGLAALGPSTAHLVAGCHAPFRLARGANDPLVTLDQLKRLDDDAYDLPECGHTAHVERPDLVAALVFAAL